MILIDIPMPEQCGECPCSYYIQTGKYEGCMMCNAMEYKNISDGVLPELDGCLVFENGSRPDGCPIVSEIS